MGPSVTKIDDNKLIELINAAQERLVFMTPGMSEVVAEAFCEKWVELTPQQATVIIDVDPEVCRVGYGTLDAIKRLNNQARELHTDVFEQPGIRLAVLVADNKTLIYSPSPLLIEGGSNSTDQPNAIMLDSVPTAIAEDLGLGESGNERKIGLEKVKKEKILETSNDLVKNPPLQFDLARKVRVFNSQIEFVEFEMTGHFISKKTVKIPGDLMGLANDKKTKDLLRSSCKIIDPQDSSVSGQKLADYKDAIIKKYLINLTGFGSVVLRVNKNNFRRSIVFLERYIDRYKKRVEESLQKAIDSNRKTLAEALAPTVVRNPPARWIKFLGRSPDKEAVTKMLDSELSELFGNANRYMNRIEVKLLFKGVTYESLNDAKFVEIAKKKIPHLDVLHEEYHAAKASDRQVSKRETQGTLTFK